MAVLATGRRYDLTGFVAHLTADGTRRRSTIALYASIVRTALKRLRDTSAEAVQMYAATTPNMQFVSAWNLFVIYAKGKGFEVAPVATEAKARRAPSICAPHTHAHGTAIVAVVEQAIRARFVYYDRCPLVLEDFCMSETGLVLLRPPKHKEYDFVLPAHASTAARELLAWAWGEDERFAGSNDNRPLIPEALSRPAPYVIENGLMLRAERPRVPEPSIAVEKLIGIAVACKHAYVLRRLQAFAVRAPSPSAP